jgi:hypothetical protein
MWVLLGFLISYLLFFIQPIFFSSKAMQFPKYLPQEETIGVDLQQTLWFSKSFFVARHFIGDYTPFTDVLFAPLHKLQFLDAYKVITLFSLSSYMIITLIIPLLMCETRNIASLPSLIFITGLFSYGFQFELERGQFNCIAFCFCLVAIWIYHYHYKYRCLAYILFIISVQLKIYPLIFIVMLIRNWQDWRGNIKRLVIFATVNFAALFLFGPTAFIDFLKATTTNIQNPGIRFHNHSLSAFVTLASDFASTQGWTWVKLFVGSTQLIFLALIGVCIFLIILQTYRQKQNDMNPLLLLACTIGALVIPSVSYDYTLSILAAPVAIVFLNSRFLENENATHRKILSIVLLLIYSFAYSSTLFPSTNKSSILQSNFPALFTMLVVITIFTMIVKPSLKPKVSTTNEIS